MTVLFFFSGAVGFSKLPFYFSWAPNDPSVSILYDYRKTNKQTKNNKDSMLDFWNCL